MITNLDEFVKGLINKGVNKNGSIYAQIIKGERIKQHKTLEEVSSGICSISYLCKLENDMIYPPKNLVKKVFERMNIKYEDFENYEFDDLLFECCEYYFNKDYFKLEESYLKVIQFDSCVQISLIKCLVNLLEYKLNDVCIEVEHLNSIKETLGGIESLLLILVTIDYFILCHNYSRAYNYLRCLDYVKIDNKFIKYKILEDNLIVSFNLKNGNRFVNSYNKLNELEYNGFPMRRRIEYRLMYNVFKYEDYPIEAFDDTASIDLDYLNGVEYYKALYYKMIIDIFSYKWTEVFDEIIKREYYKKEEFMGLLAYCSFKINSKEYYDKLMEIFSLEENEEYYRKKNIIHKHFISFVLLYGLSNNIDEIKEYMKNNIICNMKLVNHFLYDDIYKEVYLSILKQTFQYKEAFTFLSNIYNVKYNEKVFC